VAPDASVLYHDNDVALTPIRLSLPHPPPIDKIDGYGLAPHDQRFRRHELPHKLKRLEEISLEIVKGKADNDKSFTATLYKIQKEFWDTLQTKRDYYDEETKWIQNEWWYILNGYWFFCNGKPTYITGWHYFYLTYWKIDGQFFPDYRDRDRKEFLFFHYAYTTKETFANVDNNGIAIANDDGTYEMIEMANRTCFGVGQNKHRRSGNTNKGLCIVWLMTSTHKGTDGGGIMSMSGDNAEAHMKKKLLPAWRKMPLFIKPLTSSSNDPTAIVNQAPKNEIGIESMENAISAAGTADAKFYDGKKLWAILIDESGKAKNIDVRERHGVLQHCISQGNGTIIFGFEYQPSTAEELTAGGKEFKGLLDDSYFYKRNKETGQTRAGLFRLFIPADEGLDGYIDSYGNSISGRKVTEHMRKSGFKTTATIALESERKQLLNDSKRDPEAMVTYRMKKKQFPLCYDDSWIGEAGDIGFDVEIIDKRLAELSRDRGTEKFDLEWMGEPFKSGVKPVPNPINGRWNLSKLLPKEEANKLIKDSFWDTEKDAEAQTYRPKYPDRFTCGADPFNFRTESQARISDGRTKKASSRASDGGIAVFWHRDYLLDPENKSLMELESNRFVATYRYRESDNIKYTEDVLKTCIYFGAMCFPEVNIRIVWEKFHEWGYDGFLKYQVDPVSAKIKDYPGVQSLDRSKQEGFNEIRNHISLHGHREKHEDLLMEWKSINGMEEMTRYDLLAASMCALLGAKSTYGKIVSDENEYNYDITRALWW
jgi:hypothetical protein